MSAPETAQATLLLGGVRSGKSARAVLLAAGAGGLATAGERVLFAATAELLDDDMQRRAARHRLERPDSWQTLEAPLELAAQLDARRGSYDVAVVDCLTLWVSNLLLSQPEAPGDDFFAARADELMAVHARSGAHWIMVSNEVGLGIVPPTSLGRAYRDALGRVNQRVAAAATKVELLVAGLVIGLKG